MRIARIAAVLVMVASIACTTSDAANVRQWKGELPIAPAFLRKQLPPDVVLYARMPNLLGLLAMPKNNQLDKALRSEANITSIRSIQQGLAQNVLALPTLSDPRLRFLADAVRSPIEVAGFGLPNPAVLIGATLATRSKADFNQLFADLGRAGPSVSLAAPLDDQGMAQVVGLPITLFVKFDPGNGRLLLLAAPRLTRAAFEAVLQSLPANREDHPMYALEQKIDASGQGLFVWADAARIVPMTKMIVPNFAQTLGKMGLGGLRAVAFGFGTANGKGRLSLVLDAGDDPQARPFPVVANNIRATAVGDPDAAVLVSIPGQAEVSRLESMLLGALPPRARTGLEQARGKLKDLIGVDVEEIFSAIGPDVVFLFDHAGDYTAVHLRNPALFDDLVRRIAARTGSGPDERKIGGTTFHHWRLPSVFSPAASPAATRPGPGQDILTVLGRMHNHVYWIRDGEYLYVAKTPQPLMDRVHAGARTRVADWLATKQRVDMSTSLFAATGSVRKMPRRTYEMYVGILQDLADVTDAKFDVYSMPSADQLALPDKGAVGFSINSGEPYLSFELTYENHPGELLFGGGGIGMVATVGILAAIAIPAYQDYTIRAQVTEGLNLAAAIKTAVAESYAAKGVMPKDRAAAGLAPAPEATSGRYVASIDVSTGVITITYGDGANARLRGRTLAMTPILTPDGDLYWRCGNGPLPSGTKPPAPDDAGGRAGTTIEPKYLPAACR
jgi:Tfp pilus assembly major pilin PilA